jgi:hypothetical protein
VQRIVIDTDGGVDDALALLLALVWPETQVADITTVHGNVPVETATRNVREVLHLAGREVNLAEGAPLPSPACFPGLHRRFLPPTFTAAMAWADGFGLRPFQPLHRARFRRPKRLRCGRANSPARSRS